MVRAHPISRPVRYVKVQEADAGMQGGDWLAAPSRVPVVTCQLTSAQARASQDAEEAQTLSSGVVGTEQLAVQDVTSQARRRTLSLKVVLRTWHLVFCIMLVCSPHEVADYSKLIRCCLFVLGQSTQDEMGCFMLSEDGLWARGMEQIRDWNVRAAGNVGRWRLESTTANAVFIPASVCCRRRKAVILNEQGEVPLGRAKTESGRHVRLWSRAGAELGILCCFGV